MRNEHNTSWKVGRLMWLGGAIVGAVGAWLLFKEPTVWFVVGGAAAMGVGNWIRHNDVFDD